MRELRNVVERAVYRWDNWEQPIGEVVFDPFDSPWKPLPGATPAGAENTSQSARQQSAPRPRLDDITDLRAAVDDHEKSIVEHALGANRWNQRQTAQALGLTYDQLRHTMKKHAIGQEK